MMKMAVFCFFAAFAAATSALADMAVSPLRQVIDADHRQASFFVSNPTQRILEGRASWIDLTATPTGYVTAAASTRPSLSAAPWLTLRPAHFRLEPGARVEILIEIKDGAIPPIGERRSHLLIETAAVRTLMRKASDKGLQVDIDAGVSAPVILRGPGASEARIAETKLLRDNDGLLLLSTAIEQEGAHSSFGKLVAVFEPKNDGGATQTLAIRENIAGYLDAEMRLYELPLGFFSLGAGRLTLRYEGAEEFEGRVFDERRYEIAPPE